MSVFSKLLDRLRPPRNGRPTTRLPTLSDFEGAPADVRARSLFILAPGALAEDPREFTRIATFKAVEGGCVTLLFEANGSVTPFVGLPGFCRRVQPIIRHDPGSGSGSGLTRVAGAAAAVVVLNLYLLHRRV